MTQIQLTFSSILEALQAKIAVFEMVYGKRPDGLSLGPQEWLRFLHEMNEQAIALHGQPRITTPCYFMAIIVYVKESPGIEVLAREELATQVAQTLSKEQA